MSARTRCTTHTLQLLLDTRNTHHPTTPPTWQPSTSVLCTHLHDRVQQGGIGEPHDVVDAVHSIRRVPCTRHARERRYSCAVAGKLWVVLACTPLWTRRQSTAHVSVLKLKQNLVLITAKATCAHSALDKTFNMTNAPATPGTAKSKVNYGVKQRAGVHLAGSGARGRWKSQSARCQAVWQRC